MFNNFKKIIKGLCAVMVLSLFTVGNAQAQLEDAGELLRAAEGDLNSLMESYIGPYTKGFGANLNTGWFNTAKAHGTLGFDLSVNVAAAVVPTSDQLFEIAGLQGLTVTSGSSETPTIAGADNTNTRVGVVVNNPQTGNDEVVTEFDFPAGTGFQYVPSPMIQASIGIIKDTDISLRYVPEVTAPVVDASLGLFGVGVKHGINQWLPGGKILPVDISVQIGYTSFSASAGFDVNPEVPQGSNDPEIENTYAPSTWDDQGIELETTSMTYNAVVGKTIPFISVYGGVGFETSKTTITTPGQYPITVFNDDYPNNPSQEKEKEIRAVNAPVDLEIEGANNMRAFVGARFSLAILRISASYTLSNYSTFNVGVGFGFR